MGVRVIHGNIFTSRLQTLVNTINCVGVMGAGIALEFRLRYPDMYRKYVELCEKDKISIGMLWLYKGQDRWVLNFPTKKHWKFPSKLDYLHAGLRKFVDTYESRGIRSIAFPLLGADRGGIKPEESLKVMKTYLDPLKIDIEIYRYDPAARDDLYMQVRGWLLNRDVEETSEKTRLRRDYVYKVIHAIKQPGVVQINQLGKMKGIGIKTLEKIFSAAQDEMKASEPNNQKLVQVSLFNDPTHPE